MSVPKVSVVMAAYNAAPYVRQALDSLCAQTLKEIEIICVDDCSTDETWDILQEYASLDCRIRLFQNLEKSDGAGAARNIGMDKARGEYLSVLDADDFFVPEMLEKAFDKAKSTEADTVIFDGWEYDNEHQRSYESGFILQTAYVPRQAVFTPQEAGAGLFRMTLGSAWNLLISRELVQGCQIRFESLHHADDLTFTCLVLACSRSIAVLFERLLYYRRNVSDSQYANLANWPETGCEALVRLQFELQARNVYTQYKAAFVCKALDYALCYLAEMTDWERFQRLYLALQQKYWSQLDVYIISDEIIGDMTLVRRRNMVGELSPEEYLFQTRLRSGEFAAGDWLGRLSATSRCVVYGAGEYGRLIVSQLMAYDCRLLAWLDRRWRQLGWPVGSPEELASLDYDYVLVAVKEHRTYAAICASLEKMGVAKNRIIWAV